MEKIPFNQIIIRLVVFVSLISLIIVGKSMHVKQASRLLICFGGDTMLGRGVNEVIPLRGYAYPWGNLLPILKKPDLTIVNLENTFTTNTSPIPKVFNFRAYPDRIKSLKLAGIDVVNIANNHILDFGQEGLYDTLDALDKAGIKYVGAGVNAENASRAIIINKRNFRIGIIGYTDNEPSWQAGPIKPGINYIRIGDIKKIQNDVNAIRQQVDLVIVSIHWGPNMRKQPSNEFITFAHQMIDSGVDIIHGHSAHIFQGIEIYKNKLIMYDTGELVDDYQVDSQLRNDQSFLYTIYVNKGGIQKIKLIPIIISNYQANKTEGTLYTEILKRMQRLSKQFGTTIENDGLIAVQKKEENAQQYAV